MFLSHSLTRRSCFTLCVSGDANNSVVNVSRALVPRCTLKFAGELVQGTDRHDLYNIFTDLFLTGEERKNRISEGIPLGKLGKLRSGAKDAKTDNKVENALKALLAHAGWSSGISQMSQQVSSAKARSMALASFTEL